MCFSNFPTQQNCIEWMSFGIQIVLEGNNILDDFREFQANRLVIDSNFS